MYIYWRISSLVHCIIWLYGSVESLSHGVDGESLQRRNLVS